MDKIYNITSVNNETIKYFVSLNDKKTRTKENKFLIEGLHLVQEAKKTNLLESIITSDETLLKEFNNVTKYVVNNVIISKLSTTKSPQNILGVVKMLNHDITILDKILKKQEVRLVMLDDINDPGNLGTIIRTSAAIQYDAIILSPNSVDLYNEKVIRSTQGVLFKIPIIKAPLSEVITKLKKNKITCIGTSLKKAIPLEKTTHLARYSICFGNEARGMNELTLKQMDFNIKLEMKNDVESLNVAVASGIIMYELMK